MIYAKHGCYKHLFVETKIQPFPCFLTMQLTGFTNRSKHRRVEAEEFLHVLRCTNPQTIKTCTFLTFQELQQLTWILDTACYNRVTCWLIYIVRRTTITNVNPSYMCQWFIQLLHKKRNNCLRCPTCPHFEQWCHLSSLNLFRFRKCHGFKVSKSTISAR